MMDEIRTFYRFPILFFSKVFLLLVLLGCNQTQSPNNAPNITSEQPKQVAVYLRGGFNNWGHKDPFIMTNDGKYQVTVSVGLGIHEYKIASKDWQTQYMISERSEAVVDIQAQQSKHFLLAKNATEDADLLLVERAGQYQFTFDATSSDMASVTIKRIADLSLQSSIRHNPNQQINLNFSSLNDGQQTARFSVVNDAAKYKQYVHSTSQALRDPVPQINQFSENPMWPILRTGNTAFDGLFALAIDEMQLNSVANIQDGTYNHGDEIACDCFKTGEKWDYVWTRDLSYAAHLSLGFLDTQRVHNSLLFKLSGYRQGIVKPLHAKGSVDGLQIIQDTGSGGSWPISSDRVTWAFGALSTLNNLPIKQRSQFVKTSFKALVNTLENDRFAAFDIRLGLYTGEQSFLDWREQTYANWIKDDLSFMATSISISTNAAHYQALILAHQLALELNEIEQAERYKHWATQLKSNINKHLWLEDYGLYSSLTTGNFAKTPMPKFDWLGQSLAIITGLADSKQRASILANYPHGPMGAPVIFPQQPNIRIYHNRSIWPFVTAYGLQAAIKGNNVSVANQAFDTLIRGAALNLSNMENLEWLSGQSIWLERENVGLSGPVINSKHQLWSVAGYLNMIIEGVFGLKSNHQGLTVSPYLTTHLREKYFAKQTQISLRNITWQQRKIHLMLKLPPLTKQPGVYKVASISVNGNIINSNLVKDNLLDFDENQVVITLSDILPGNTDITLINAVPKPKDSNVFAPLEPTIAINVKDKKASINIIDDYNQNVHYSVYRNGNLVADNINKKVYVDNETIIHQACYSVSATFNSNKNQSHHSNLVCANEGQLIKVDDARITSNIKASGELPILSNYGAEHDRFIVNDVEIVAKGDYAIQLNYSNKNNKTNTGITAGVKWLTIKNTHGEEVASGVIQLPHIKADEQAKFSTPLITTLNKGRYQMVLSDFYNMSYLTNNQTYSQAGGQLGVVNTFDIFSLRVMPINQ